MILHLAEEQIVEAVLSLEMNSFYKSMTSHDDHSLGKMFIKVNWKIISEHISNCK